MCTFFSMELNATIYCVAEFCKCDWHHDTVRPCGGIFPSNNYYISRGFRRLSPCDILHCFIMNTKLGQRWLEFLLLAWTCQLSGFSLTTSSSWYNTIIRIILVYNWSIWRIPRRHGLANETTKINQIITTWGHLAYYTHSPLWWLGYFIWTADLKETKKSDGGMEKRKITRIFLYEKYLS